MPLQHVSLIIGLVLLNSALPSESWGAGNGQLDTGLYGLKTSDLTGLSGLPGQIGQPGSGGAYGPGINYNTGTQYGNSGGSWDAINSGQQITDPAAFQAAVTTGGNNRPINYNTGTQVGNTGGSFG